MRREIMCQYGNCLEIMGENGVSVTLRSKTRDEETKAVFCSARHAALSLLRLAQDRDEHPGEPLIGEIPRNWKTV